MIHVSYILSIKEEFFYWCLNGLYTAVEKLGLYMMLLKNEYLDFSKYIDISIYHNNKPFRLPNRKYNNKLIPRNIEVL